MTAALPVTLDTNMLDDYRIGALQSCIAIPYELAIVTVSGRERGELTASRLNVVREACVWDDSLWDQAVWDRAVRPANQMPSR